MQVQQKIEAYLQVRDAYDKAHATSVMAHRDMKFAESDLIDAMLDEGVKAHKLDNGINVSLRKQYSCSVNKGNEADIRRWLIEEEGDDKQFMVEKVHKPALLDWLRSRGFEPEDAPAFLQLSTRPGITVRGWQTREAE